MDSINRNQPEDNHQNISNKQAINKVKEIVDNAKTCFFCTFPEADSHTRPMTVQQVDDQGNLWFLSAADSYKNLELTNDSAVRLYFQGSKHSDFLYLDGFATILKDKQKIEELWEFVMSTWFTDGIDDPRITVIKVKPTVGYYWDTKHGNTIAGIKMLIGSIVHKTLDDSVEGNITI